MLTENKIKNPKPYELVSDWYLPEDAPLSGYVFPGPVFIKENESLSEMAIRLEEEAKTRGTEEFVVKMDGMMFRGHKILSIDGVFFALRRVPRHIPTLDEIGMDRSIQALLMHKKMGAGGLIIIAGETGQGKSTTAGAFLKARMEKHGSFCLTIEDPPELPLHGKCGRYGMCIQTDVKSGFFGDALKGAMRSYPTQGDSILFVGEMRDPETAGEVLRIATNGHMVVTTMHAADIISGLKRFQNLAMAHKNMTENEAKSVLSSALRLFIHQKIRKMPDNSKQLEIKTLFSADHTSPVANRIRGGSIEGVSTDIQQQALMITQGQVDKMLAQFDLFDSAHTIQDTGLKSTFSGKSSLSLAGIAPNPSKTGFFDKPAGPDPLDDLR